MIRNKAMFVSARSMEDLSALLANRSQWKPGHSAWALGHSWAHAPGLPQEIASIFEASGNPVFHAMDTLVIIPEHKVPLAGKGHKSQNDLFLLARGDAGLVSVVVEGKVSEPFGQTVGRWLGDHRSSGKKERLKYLIRMLEISERAANDIRYQLLHRTVSALVEAERICAPSALMLVHSFSRCCAHYDDFERFVSLFGIGGEKDTLLGPVRRQGKNLYFCWARGEEKYLGV